MSRNPYDVLGVQQGASEDEIKSAYRKLAKKLHPDVNSEPDAQDRFREISEAYEQLTKPQPQQQQGGFTHNGFHFHFEGDDMHRAMFEQMMRSMREQEIRAQNSDLQTTVHITLEQAFTGCEVDVHLRQLEGSPNHRVAVPKGIGHGQRIRVPGAGLHRNKSYPAGDLYVVVGIHQHDRFVRSGDDLLTRVEVNSFEAILGASRTIIGIDGEQIEVSIPSGCQYGDRVRIAGKGMMMHNGESRGSLVTEIVVETPSVITEEHRNLVNQIVDLLPNQQTNR